TRQWRESNARPVRQMRGDDAAVSGRHALRGRGRAGAEPSREMQLVREALQVRGTSSPLRPRRGQRADVAGAEGEAGRAADAALTSSSAPHTLLESPAGRLG